MIVSLHDVARAAAARGAILTADMAGYLVLAAAERLEVVPVDPEGSVIRLAEDGSVHVAGGVAVGEAAAEERLRNELGRLLSVALGAAPTLRAVSRRASAGVLATLVGEIEAAMIPLNRAAGRRALARLHREVERSRERGRLGPLPSGPGKRDASAKPPDVVEAPPKPAPASDAAPVDLSREPTPAPAPASDAAPVDLSREPTPAPTTPTASVPVVADVAPPVANIDLTLRVPPVAPVAPEVPVARARLPRTVSKAMPALYATPAGPVVKLAVDTTPVLGSIVQAGRAPESAPPQAGGVDVGWRTPALPDPVLVVSQPDGQTAGEPRGAIETGPLVPAAVAVIEDQPRASAQDREHVTLEDEAELSWSPPEVVDDEQANERVVEEAARQPVEAPEPNKPVVRLEPNEPMNEPVVELEPHEPVEAPEPREPVVEEDVEPVEPAKPSAAEEPRYRPRRSDVSELLSKFEVVETRSDGELARELKRIAGLDATPPPVAVHDADDHEPGEVRRDGTASDRRWWAVGGLGAMLALGAALTAGPAAFGSVGSPEICTATLEIASVRPGVEVRVREVGGPGSWRARVANGPVVELGGLPCGRDHEAVVRTEQGWARVLVSGDELNATRHRIHFD